MTSNIRGPYDGSLDYNYFSYYRHPYLVKRRGCYIRFLNIESYESQYIIVKDFENVVFLKMGKLKDQHI